MYGLASHSTHNRSFRGRFLQARDQTNSVKALKENQLVIKDQAWIRPEPLHHVTIIRLHIGNRLYAQRKGPSVGPVRTADISVLRIVNIVSHNSAQSCSDNIPSWPPDKGSHWEQNKCEGSEDCVTKNTLVIPLFFSGRKLRPPYLGIEAKVGYALLRRTDLE